MTSLQVIQRFLCRVSPMKISCSRSPVLTSLVKAAVVCLYSTAHPGTVVSCTVASMGANGKTTNSKGYMPFNQCLSKPKSPEDDVAHESMIKKCSTVWLPQPELKDKKSVK